MKIFANEEKKLALQTIILAMETVKNSIESEITSFSIKDECNSMKTLAEAFAIIKRS